MFQTAEAVLNTVITSTMVQGVLDEIVGLLPTILPVSITFISIRKGLSFVLGTLRAA